MSVLISVKLHKKTNAIKIPAYTHEKVNKLIKRIAKLSDILMREPTIEEISKYTKLDENTINKLLMYRVNPLSLSVPINDDENIFLGDTLSDENINIEQQLINSERHNIIFKLLDESNLTTQEKEILKYRCGYYNDYVFSLEEIGKIFNLTKERIRQIEKNALLKLRSIENLEILVEYSNNPNMNEEDLNKIKSVKTSMSRFKKK